MFFFFFFLLFQVSTITEMKADESNCVVTQGQGGGVGVGWVRHVCCWYCRRHCLTFVVVLRCCCGGGGGYRSSSLPSFAVRWCLGRRFSFGEERPRNKCATKSKPSWPTTCNWTTWATRKATTRACWKWAPAAALPAAFKTGTGLFRGSRGGGVPFRLVLSASAFNQTPQTQTCAIARYRYR